MAVPEKWFDVDYGRKFIKSKDFLLPKEYVEKGWELRNLEEEVFSTMATQTQEQRNECEYWRVETLRWVKKELGHKRMIDLGLGDLARAGIVEFKFHDVKDGGNPAYMVWSSGNPNINMLTDVLYAFDYMGVKQKDLDVSKITLNWSKRDHEELARLMWRGSAPVEAVVEIDDLDEAVELLGVGGGSW